jgi:Gas vesicle synthesis protein GvpL/GvpF
VPDELGRWAAARAPELVARAEAAAVEELKRALVAAARGDRAPAPAPPARPAQRGDGIWAYCVADAGARLPEQLPGVAPGAVQRIEHGSLAVLVSRVPLDEFGEEPLRGNLNDFEWLERVARAHESVLEDALAGATIVPLRLCTIFADEAGAKDMLDERHAALTAALDALAGREEWSVKLLVDRDSLMAAARAELPVEERSEPQGGGAAYMLKRREERRAGEAADRLAGSLAEDVHARLQDWASDAVLSAPQNRELSGHEGDMLLNGAYLVEREKVDRLRELVAELAERHRELGARLELSGPLPPYNFVPRSA